MAGESSTDQNEALSGADVIETASQARKRREKKPAATTARTRKRQLAAEAAVKPATTSRRHTDAEKIEKIAQIQSAVSGGATLKAATRNAGITEQTFYIWKRSGIVAIEALPPLAELEAENVRLRALLAQKLRQENEDLRKRLGQI